MWSRDDLGGAAPGELADLAGASLRLLAQSDDPAAFGYLLEPANTAGTTRQAAWERWRCR
jgi:hypothetical protein